MSPGPGALSRLAEIISQEGEPLVLRPTWQPPVAAGTPAAYPEGDPRLGELAAAGPLTTSDPDGYAFVVEAIREGFLCHYGESRLLDLADSDLALLTGDLLYAIGLKELSRLDDLQSTGILSDLIRVAADLRAGGLPELAATLWPIQVVALSCGKPDDYEARMAAVSELDQGSFEELLGWAAATADQAGMGPEFRVASEAIHLRPSNL